MFGIDPFIFSYRIVGMINIFDVFLPQLLRYPNPADPLNGEAAALLLRDSIKYENQVRGRFASS